MKFSRRLFRSIVIFCLFWHGLLLFSLDVPPLTAPVNDYAQLFTKSEVQELNTFLYSVDQNSDLQIAVLTIPSLEDETIEDFSIRVAERWELGKKEKDSGVILVIAAQERKLRIEVGYGLEELITDAQSNKIIRSVIIPYFEKQEYGKGALMGVKNIAGLVLKDESLINKTVQEQEQKDSDSIPLPIIIFLIIVFLFGSRFMPGGLFWPLLFFSSGRRGFGSGSSSSDRFSGKGGRFGGGGASGSW